ncbi:toll/interleukin-1 receptor domain-containing protein [Actinoplanes sp. NPDC049596]|uniref:toll/interleukin-1 receptor domain-containing protein n=1 Tax=unclassified Actinoplanes TaxID=2626549 RepID=UPI0034152452
MCRDERGTAGVRAQGELTVYFSDSPSEETRFLFEEYVHDHLEARAVPGSVERDRVFTCPGCAYRVPIELVRRRQARGDSDMACPDCETVRISLLDREDRLSGAGVRQMNTSADLGRDRSVATASVRGKESTRDYDVYLSYDHSNRDIVDRLVGQLRQAGLLASTFNFDARFTETWAHGMRQRVGRSRSAVVFLGPPSVRERQDAELAAVFDEQRNRPDFRVALMALPGTSVPELLPLARVEILGLRHLQEGLETLRRVITGERPRDEFPILAE